MSDRQTAILLILGVLVAISAGIGIMSPGYMDAEYYYLTGRELSLGNGFQEPIIWNYLNSPSELPQPSHGYWMPLTSLISALPMWLGGRSFQVAKIPFTLLFALLPLLTARYSLSVHKDKKAAFLAGLFAALPGFFLPYFLTTDMFILYAWIGLLFFWSLHYAQSRESALWWTVGGISIGLAHLARADGLLFVIPFLYLIMVKANSRTRWLFAGLAGYLMIVTPWFIRNLAAFGTLLPPGTQATLWLRSYEDLFRYPASELSPAFLLEAGLGKVIVTRFSALWINLQRVVAENGYVFLLPLMIVGMYEKWELKIVRSATLYWGVLLFVMSFIFPFAGAQGGTFHSSAALMPTLWMLIPFGLRKVVAWVGSRRGWDVVQATSNFGWILLGLAGLFTIGVYIQRVYGIDREGVRWSEDLNTYSELGDILSSLDSQPGLVMVNNPPGFYVASSLQAVVVPSGGVDALRGVVREFGVEYVILDRNHPSGLNKIYDRERIIDWLELIEQVDIGRAAPVLIFKTGEGQGNP
jgi:4-amino-4-deoxy-L-arabinose transferase-like glycosyltransferase